jgi:hypothetical protein
MNTLDPSIAAELAKQGITAPTQTNSQNNVVNAIDNNQNNSYNTTNTGEPPATTGDSPEEKFGRILNDTFGGDATKAVKSWVEAQSKYADTSREYKRIKSEYENFNTILQTNPALFDLVQRASRGEKIENLLSQTQEPQGKPTSSTNAFQLDGSTSVDERKLVEAGYLDKTKLDSMDDFSRQMAILGATQRYMFEVVPKEITRRTQQELEQQRAEEQRRVTSETTAKTNLQRWQDGIKNAAVSGWDFTGQHETLLDELEAEVNGIRDTKNLNLISEDAVQIALDRIARRNGIKVKTSNPTQQSLTLPNGQKNFNQTNMNSKGSQGSVEVEDFHHKLILAQQQANRSKPQDYLQKYKTTSR